jgi:hypothetical protein
LHQAALSLDNPAGEALLIAYVVGGILLAAASLLPGNSIGWRIFSIVVGLGVAAWAGYVFLFGGWIIISFKILILPIVLVVKSIVTTVKRKDTAPAAPMPGQQFNPAPPAGYGYPGAPGGFPQPPQGYPQQRPAPPAHAPSYGGFIPQVYPHQQQPQAYPQQGFQQPPAYPPVQQPPAYPPAYPPGYPPAQPPAAQQPQPFHPPAPYTPPVHQFQPPAPRGPAAFNSVQADATIAYEARHPQG